MVSSADFKKLYDLYQVEGLKEGVSIVQFCKMYGFRPVKYVMDVLRKWVSGQTDYMALLLMNITK